MLITALASCLLVLAHSCLYRPQGSVCTPCACSNPPMLVHTPRTRLVLAPSHLYHPWGSVCIPCACPPVCSPHCCCCRCLCHCTYAFAGSLVHVRPPCICLPLCGTLTVTEQLAFYYFFCTYLSILDSIYLQNKLIVSFVSQLNLPVLEEKENVHDSHCHIWFRHSVMW